MRASRFCVRVTYKQTEPNLQRCIKLFAIQKWNCRGDTSGRLMLVTHEENKLAKQSHWHEATCQMNILLDFQEIQFLEIHCGPLRANVADSYDCRPPAVHTNKHTVQTYTKRQLRCVATETPFSQRKKKKKRGCKSPSLLSVSQKRIWNSGVEIRWGSGVTHSAHALKCPTHTHLS